MYPLVGIVNWRHIHSINILVSVIVNIADM